MKFIVVFFVMFAVAACGPKIYVDYDPEVDYTKLSSYTFIENEVEALNELDQKRFTAAIQEYLKKQNYHFNNTPVVGIQLLTNLADRQTHSTIGIGVGGGGGHINGGISGGIPITQTKKYLQVTLNLVFLNNRELFWQATTEVVFNPNMNPEEREQFFKALANQLLKKYPPKKKK
ncbi:MAG: DUF4136 domain-containing protein [Mesonia hippocampi]|uniref:DUF4136 domain-containing protein n=1 Tax=Mesonia hippocampi TaxID=1628250 RepID=UPI003F9BD481